MQSVGLVDDHLPDVFPVRGAGDSPEVVTR